MHRYANAQMCGRMDMDTKMDGDIGTNTDTGAETYMQALMHTHSHTHRQTRQAKNPLTRICQKENNDQ